MAINKILVPTAAVAGVLGAVSMPGMALAQGSDNPFVLSFEGSVGKGDHSNAYGEAKLGNGFDVFDDDTSFVGSVGLSRSINDTWDWNLSVSRLNYSDNVLNNGDAFNSVTFGTGSKRTDVAFTMTRDVAVGSAKARLGVGLAYANASTEKGLNVIDDDINNGPGGYFRNDFSTTFQGIGPRLSLEMQSAPVSGDGKLSVIGGVEVSLLAGQYKHSKGFEAYDGNVSPTFEGAESSSGDMMTAGLMIGLNYDASDSTSFRAGVRHDVTRMDRGSLGNGPFEIDGVDVNDAQTSFFLGMDVSF